MALGILYNKIPIYPMFYLLKGDYKALQGSERCISSSLGSEAMGCCSVSGIET